MDDVAVEGRRRSRERRWILFVLAGLLVLLAGYVGFDAWAGRRLRLATEHLEQRYGTLSQDSLRTAAVPAEENRARLVQAAAALGVPPKDAVKTFLTNASKSPKIPSIPPEVHQFIEANRDALRIAGTFTSRARASWEIEPDGSHGPDLLQIRVLSDVLFASAIEELSAGRPDEASKAVEAGLAVSASLREENQLIAQLIRIAIAARQIDAIQLVLAESEPSAAALKDLAARLSENRAPDPIRVGLVAEMKLVHGLFSRLESGRADATVKHPGLFRLGRPITRLVHARSLETIDALLQVQSGPRPKGPFPIVDHSVLSRFDLGSTSGLARAIETGDDFMSMQGAAETAVALRRYRIDRGAYPEDLATLVPAYLPALPIDPFTGKPPVYGRQGSGFTLQSQRYSPRASQPWPPITWVVRK